MSGSRYRLRERIDPPIPDAPGCDLKPRPISAGTAAEFMADLRWLRTWAGEPSLRELSRRCGHSPSGTTFGKMLKSDDLPPMDLVLVFVDALGLSADREEWRTAWRRLRQAEGDRT